MSYTLIIRPEAELDIQDTFEWYEAQSPGLGSEFVRAVDACLSSIGRNPLAYPLIYRQARRALIRRFPYGILYVFEQETIFVVACFHGKRNPKSWQQRL
ncbi:type II toxin-antitoxin system RelE/ParE family toxin [Leptodesmis sichuanensis]|uniref:type II toxin-antitoxin system RelE/ParE family toxin n=1 Tax=Leptodesmis sichuanensis TaxID=2906798 RepID=UPI001F31FDB6|nr:type II toxin-antitoxin system RelE/ParE family toxin [Leptodesmis sichuanensis]UIE38868.1 type II toxin-antitoxin system RelE/ParE family toxin [Leptodesmis sichuanensis A121]